ncbi:MAG: IclR family transcriptional regulator [Anaerolineae bacterium]
MSETRRDYTIQALDNGLQVLEAFLKTNQPTLRMTDISTSLGLNKSRVFRILCTLERHGLVEQDEETKAYRLGTRMIAFAEAARRRLDLVRIAGPYLDHLAEQSSETVHLGIADGYEAICVAKRESPQSIRLYAEVGRRAPLHQGGVPKVLLAFMPPEERESVLAALEESAPLHGYPAVDRARLEQQLERIREEGYAIVVDELDPGSHSIAAPIRDYSGRVVAAVSIAGPSHRFTPDKISRFVQLVRQAADEISHRLGYRDTDHPAET